MSFTIKPMYAASCGCCKKCEAASPLKTHIDGKPHWKTKVKYRKDGTFKKVVTKSKRKSGNKEHKGLFKGGRYRSVIKFDKSGKIKSAKNNRTKNKHKKSPQRIKRAKWIERDLTPYNDPSSIVYAKPDEKKKMFNKGKKYKPKTNEAPNEATKNYYDKRGKVMKSKKRGKTNKSSLGPAFN